MKLTYYFFILMAASSLFLSHRYDTVDENGRAGSTGSPGETSCANSTSNLVHTRVKTQQFRFSQIVSP